MKIKKISMNRISGAFFLFLLAVIILASCDTSRHVPYFKDVTDSLHTSAVVNEFHYSEPTIQPNDVLQVSVQTIDPKTSEIFSQAGKSAVEGGMSTGGIGGAGSQSGYQVDKDGNIELPIAGRVHVGGLTIIEARDKIKELVSKYYIDPAVNVRFLNFYITILGDVTRPGRYSIINEKVSLLDALGMAGDLSLTARRDNILLIREDNGSKLFVRLDINSSKIFESPYYYLRSGDALYVQPNKAKARGATVDMTRDRYLTYISTSISIILAIITLAKK